MKEINALEKKTGGKILEDLKSGIIEILWPGKSNFAFDERWLLPFVQEEAEYNIKKLKTSNELKNYYLNKIENIMGEYGE